MLEKLNYQLYRFKYNYSPYLKLTKPVDISLELSSFCTNQCGYCYHSAAKELPFKRGFMSLDLAYKILNEASDLGVHSLKFNYRGESTMNPNFEQITWLARKLSSGSTFIDRVTNSNFNFKNDRDDIFRGLCHQTKVKVSFDSFRKEIFETQRKGSKYELTIANVNKFYNYPGRNNTLVVQSVRTQLNKDEDLEFEIKSRWPSAEVSIRDVVEGRVNKDLSNTIINKRDSSFRQSCIQAHARLIVHHNGIVVPCCPSITDALAIGDLNNQSILSVWNSSKAIQLRKDLKSKKAFESDPCKNCSSFETYKNFKKKWDS